jgi:hypothetical protein
MHLNVHVMCKYICNKVGLCYDPRGAYIGINVYDMTPRGGIYGPKCTCNV